MEQTIYYKTFTLGNKRHTITMREKMSNEDFMEIIFYIRRLFGYAMYPRWCATRLFLSEVINVLKKNNLYKHKIKKRANELLHEFDKYEKMHIKDFDEEWMEVMSSNMSNKLLPKINELRGEIGGVLLRHNIKNYILYSYPETVCVMANEGVAHFDMLMQEIREKYKMDFKEVFLPLRGYKVLASSYSLVCAIEDVIGEKLPMGIEARNTLANEKLKQIERLLVNQDAIQGAIKEACDVIDERELNQDDLFDRLSEKFNTKKV